MSEQGYAAFVAQQGPYPCPRCGGRRWRSGGHERWVYSAPGTWQRIRLVHVRCAPCRTTETLFPPWLLPYESCTLETLQHIISAINRGDTLTQVAERWDLPRLTIRRRWQRWQGAAVPLRQQVAQFAAQGGMVLHWPTWRPPPGTRVPDWSWCELAWHALAVLLGGGWIDRRWEPLGLIQWRTWAPDRLPTRVVPARCHLGRRLRLSGCPP